MSRSTVEQVRIADSVPGQAGSALLEIIHKYRAMSPERADSAHHIYLSIFELVEAGSFDRAAHFAGFLLPIRPDIAYEISRHGRIMGDRV